MKIIFANQILALIILISCLFISDSKAQTNDNIISLKKND
jgi:hypothetical protein